MPTPAGPERPNTEPVLPEGPLSLPESAEEDFRREMEKTEMKAETRTQMEALQQSILNPEAALQEALAEAPEEEKSIVDTLKEESGNFAKKFSTAKGMEKLTVVIDAIGGIADRISDALIQIGGPALNQIAALAERFGMLDKPWIDWLRQLAASDRAVLQEFLSDKSYALVQGERKADKNALNTLKNTYNAWKEAKKAAAVVPPVPAPAPNAAVPATPAAAPAVAPVVPEPTFEEYLTEMLDLTRLKGTEKDVEGRTKVTLAEVVSILPA